MHYLISCVRSCTLIAELVQKVSFSEAGWYVFFRDIADVLADERFDFELETVLEHQIDFFLPLFLIRKPRVLRNLTRPLDVLIVQFDLNTGSQLAALIVDAPETEEASSGNCHAAGFPKFVVH